MLEKKNYCNTLSTAGARWYTNIINRGRTATSNKCPRSKQAQRATRKKDNHTCVARGGARPSEAREGHLRNPAKASTVGPAFPRSSSPWLRAVGPFLPRFPPDNRRRARSPGPRAHASQRASAAARGATGSHARGCHAGPSRYGPTRQRQRAVRAGGWGARGAVTSEYLLRAPTATHAGRGRKKEKVTAK